MEKIMKPSEIRMEFIKFLKNNNAYDEYLYAVRDKIKEYKDYDKIKPLYLYCLINPLVRPKLNQIFQGKHPKDIIDRSFCWADTQQGHRFWEKLNDKWNDIAYEITIQN